jgi:conjugative relaxase-like TrwC/TraI family protein
MFTAKSQKNRAAATTYFDEHLSHNDYYTQNESEAGHWIGAELERLQLKEGDLVTREAFLAFCDHRHPVTGEALTPRRNHDGNRRLYYDFTCSAPKSVSILAVTMNDERIVDAHQTAARIAIKELEQFAAGRVRRNGKNEDRLTGNLVGAEFLHNSSRTLDPQLHTHFTLFNCTYDHVEQQWKALQTFVMYDAIRYATEVYRNALVKRLHALGYETERTSKCFEIKGVSMEIREKFSKRSAQTAAVATEMERKLGRKLSNNELSHVIHKTRPEKVKGISHAEVHRHQVSQLSAAEQQQLKAVARAARGSPTGVQNRVTEQQALDYAQEHIFERASVVPEYKLLHAALVQGRGEVELSVLKGRVQSSPGFVRVAGELSTRDILRAELSLINTVDQGKGRLAPIHPHYAPEDKSLGVDQQNAVSFILRSPDQITGIRGLAGTGKSRTLKELFRVFEEAGRAVVVCAPTGSAAENLRRDAVPAITLQRLLVDAALQHGLTSRSIIVVDEAGMVSVDDMQRLFSLAVESHVRVILCGDTGQHAAVTRGDALRILEKYSRYSFAELTENWRQKLAPDYQKAVRKAAQKQSQKAFELLEKMGAVTETGSLYEQAADAYIESLKNGKTALLISPTWSEINSLTQHVRSELKRQGLVGSVEDTVAALDSLSWTAAEKKTLRNYAAGQVIVFHQKSGAHAAHESLMVVAVEKGALRVRRKDGREEVFRPCNSAAFDVCETREVAVAPGDKLLLQTRLKARGQEFVNGEIVQVKKIDRGEICLSDGRRLPRNYRMFTYGYAVTSHAAQSRTVQDVFVVAGSPSLPAIHRRQFYVDVSRGKEHCRIFTDNKELLREKIGHPKERKAAIELRGLEEALVKAGLIQPPRQDHSEPDETGASRFRRMRGLTVESLRPDRRLSQVVRHLHALAHQFRTRGHREISKGVGICSNEP